MLFNAHDYKATIDHPVNHVEEIPLSTRRNTSMGVCPSSIPTGTATDYSDELGLTNINNTINSQHKQQQLAYLQSSSVTMTASDRMTTANNQPISRVFDD